MVPFVNLLLKAPPSPLQPSSSSSSPLGLFAGLDSPSSSSSDTSDLTRSNSNDSQLSLNSNSWGSSLTAGLQYEPSMLSEELSATFVAAGATTAAALQPLQSSLQAAAESWLGQAASDLAAPQPASISSFSLAYAGEASLSAATAADVPSLLEGSLGSRELASWLDAARGAVKQQAGPEHSQRSFKDSCRCNSNSGNSLYSLQSEALSQWPASSVGDDGTSSSSVSPSSISPASTLPVSGRQSTRYAFGVPVIASWALESSSSLALTSDSAVSPRDLSSLEDPDNTVQQAEQQAEQQPDQPSSSPPPLPAAAPMPAQQDSAAAGAEAEAEAQRAGGQAKVPLGARLARQLQRLQQQLGSTRVGRVAWISGALAAGARCASALAAPAAVTGHHVSLLALLPRALAGPAALAVLHFVGHAAYQAALPPSHPLGQQWVMTDSGLEPVAMPLTSYPRTGEGLGLQELGGLFPGHRMIAYRRRLAHLISQSPSATQQ